VQSACELAAMSHVHFGIDGRVCEASALAVELLLRCYSEIALHRCTWDGLSYTRLIQGMRTEQSHP